MLISQPVDTAYSYPHTVCCSIAVKGTPWIICLGHNHPQLHYAVLLGEQSDEWCWKTRDWACFTVLD